MAMCEECVEPHTHVCIYIEKECIDIWRSKKNYRATKTTPQNCAAIQMMRARKRLNKRTNERTDEQERKQMIELEVSKK